MWGNILTEISFQPNFNLNYSNTKSDVLIHLSQWQYWWWFWFCFLWVLYFFIILRMVRYRTLKFRPKIATTYRPHGKWGDLLVCAIPVSWCFNILVNSNFLLKLIEWQTESSLFTVRIRGKQWYWVYKYDLKDMFSVVSAPKNVGRNNWVSSNYNTLTKSDSYLESLKLRSQVKWFKKYWAEVSSKFTKIKSLRYSTDFIANNSVSNLSSLESNLVSSFMSSSNISKKAGIISNSFFLSNLGKSNYFYNFTSQNKVKSFSSLFNRSQPNNYSSVSHGEFLENSRFFKKSQGGSMPFRLIKDIKLNASSADSDLFLLRYNNLGSKVVHKNTANNIYFIFKQKRYSRRKNVNPFIKNYKDIDGNKLNKAKFKSRPVLFNGQISDSTDNLTQKYRMIKKSKVRFDEFNVAFNKRLLRTSRTLVVPAHTNITAITNSYDVIHSWFIPGLGLKMDCIPGRSTHHTFYIDNVGFYYGQCAEVCGRYHHHMPIRLCALPFEHFLVWWHSFGLPKVTFVNNKKRNSTYHGFRKFNW